MKKAKTERETKEEVVLLDDMITTLVDLLIEKGVFSEQEYENRLKQRIKVP